MRLIAKVPILYFAHLYEVGDELPLQNQTMIDAWLEAGTAERLEDGQEAAESQDGYGQTRSDRDFNNRKRGRPRRQDPGYTGAPCMSFKSIIAEDVQKTFMNPEEFSDIHNLNGVNVPVQVDSNEQIEREKRFNQHMDGIYLNQKLIYVSAEDYKKAPGRSGMPKQGTALSLDGKIYRVADAIDEGGVYSITLEANKA